MPGPCAVPTLRAVPLTGRAAACRSAAGQRQCASPRRLRCPSRQPGLLGNAGPNRRGLVPPEDCAIDTVVDVLYREQPVRDDSIDEILAANPATDRRLFCWSNGVCPSQCRSGNCQADALATVRRPNMTAPKVFAVSCRRRYTCVSWDRGGSSPKMASYQERVVGGAGMNEVKAVQVSLDLPQGVFSALRLDPAGLVDEMRLAAAVKWYEVHQISQAKAAEIAGLSRTEFLMALRRLAVSPLDRGGGHGWVNAGC